MSVKTSNIIYQLKVTLKDSKPPIWRRFQVSSTITLRKLHSVLQLLMGWEDAHLHQFRQGRNYYADLKLGEDLECFEDVKDERKTKLNAVLQKEKDKIVYDYDFGDNWEHEVVLEKILPAELGKHYPVCLEGKRSGPLEDCGGIWGYEDLLEILKDPNHPEHEERKEWVPEGFDPEHFDLSAINKSLR